MKNELADINIEDVHNLIDFKNLYIEDQSMVTHHIARMKGEYKIHIVNESTVELDNMIQEIIREKSRLNHNCPEDPIDDSTEDPADIVTIDKIVSIEDSGICIRDKVQTIDNPAVDFSVDEYVKTLDSPKIQQINIDDYIVPGSISVCECTDDECEPEPDVASIDLKTEDGMPVLTYCDDSYLDHSVKRKWFRNGKQFSPFEFLNKQSFSCGDISIYTGVSKNDARSLSQYAYIICRAFKKYHTDRQIDNVHEMAKYIGNGLSEIYGYPVIRMITNNAKNEILWVSPLRDRIKSEMHFRCYPHSYKKGYIDCRTPIFKEDRDNPSNMRAMDTLRLILGEKKYKKLLVKKSVSVKGKSGRTYQIYPGHSSVYVFKDGKKTHSICIQLDHNYPPADSLLMRYLLALGDEVSLWKLGNISNMEYENCSWDYPTQCVTPFNQTKSLVSVFTELKSSYAA